MTFRSGATGNCVGCEFTIAEGEITKDTIAAFEKYFQKEGQPRFVNPIFINSTGGDFDTALELGRLWRKYKLGGVVGGMDYEVDSEGHRLSFPVSGKCLNECVWAFMGTSRNRYFYRSSQVKKDGVIGIMSLPRGLLDRKEPLTVQDNEALRKSALLSAYAIEMGFDIRAAYAGEAGKLHVFSKQELADYRIIWHRQ